MSAFPPDEYGALLVEVGDATHVKVTAEPLTAASDPLYAWPAEQEDGTLLAAFPVIRAGNWSIVRYWAYASDPKRQYANRRLVTVFPGSVVTLKLGPAVPE